MVGAWNCPAPSASNLAGVAGAAGSASNTANAGNAGAGVPKSIEDSIELPWSTGFENEFCDYADDVGFCFSTGKAHYRLVTEPVHSGQFAAAFTAYGDRTEEPSQVRCVRQGKLPIAAYYGAWYYVPALAKSRAVWNLLHFQGDNALNRGHLWDVSLINTDSGDLRLTVFSYLTPMPSGLDMPRIPIDSWFHIEVYLKRAADETGEIIVYQDGSVIFQLTDVKTDNSSRWSQWYVGNLAEELDPVESTVYVDDVTIRATR